MQEKDVLTGKIIKCCFKVHSELGPGLNEKIYHNSLIIALKEEDLNYESQKDVIVNFRGRKVGTFKLDLVVENKVIVEIKALSGNIPEIFKHQILTYLKVSKLRVGLLVNFGNKSCEIKRFMV